MSARQPANNDPPSVSAQKQLDLLADLANLLETSQDLSRTLNDALKLLAASLNIQRGAITLIAPRSGRIRIQAAFGLNPAQCKRGDYSPGEGITGKVIATGKAVCVADVGREPLFLNRTRSRDLTRENLSFICVPIKLNGQIVGAISTDLPRSASTRLKGQLRLLKVAATLLAPAAHESQEEIREDTVIPSRPKGFVGASESIRQVYDQIMVVAPSLTTVLLRGESGTGKELAARAIHAASQRADKPFVSLNCAALPESLIESELFGHERGAFTGATQTRKGRFELANGGTLFLDEIGEISPIVQAKLLRVLQERVFERLGGMETIRADARVITATNRDLEKMVEAGAFRRDLYYRLNVFPIFLPALRQRRDDIIPLCAHFLDKFARSRNQKPPRLSLAAMDFLQRHDWPGNIRELQNVLERATLLLGHDNLLLPRHLPPDLARSTPDAYSELGKTAAMPGHGGLKATLEEVERATIENSLALCAGNMRKAAAALGITERIMALRVSKYCLDYKNFRRG